MILRMASLVVLALLAATAIWPTGARAQVGISPQILDIPLDSSGQTHSFRFYSFTAEPKRVRVSVTRWEMDENNQVHDLPPGEQSLERWMVINLTEFEVAAKGFQTIRFSIRLAVELAPGEYRAMLYFDETRNPQDKTEGTLHFRFRLGAAVYAHVGPVVRQGRIERHVADAGGLRSTVVNTGNATARFDGELLVYPEAVFPGRERIGHIENTGRSDQKIPPGAVAGGRLSSRVVLHGTTCSVLTAFANPLPAES